MIIERAPVHTKFVTSDNQQFDTREAAQKHQRYLDYAAALNKEIGGSPSLRIGENILYNASKVHEIVQQFLSEIHQAELEQKV